MCDADYIPSDGEYQQERRTKKSLRSLLWSQVYLTCGKISQFESGNYIFDFSIAIYKICIAFCCIFDPLTIKEIFIMVSSEPASFLSCLSLAYISAEFPQLCQNFVLDIIWELFVNDFLSCRYFLLNYHLRYSCLAEYSGISCLLLTYLIFEKWRPVQPSNVCASNVRV